MFRFALLVWFFGTVHSFIEQTPIDLDLVVFTIATEETDGYKRFMRSAKVFNLDVQVVGMGETWKGGDMNYAGGGQKVTLLREAVKKYKDRKKTVLMFTDSYDAIINSDAQDILTRFLKFDASVVFGAEGFCWPDKTLATKYPVVKSGKRYLNSGGFIGYAPQFWEVVSHKKIDDTFDDQLYYTQIFLDPELREKYNIKLDSISRIFQNIHGAEDDLEIQVTASGKPVLRNLAYQTLPTVIHGNGPSKIKLNHFANYLANHWTPNEGCIVCSEDKLTLSGDDSELPEIQLAIIIDQPAPFVDEFFHNIERLNYPKRKIRLFVYSIRRYVPEVKAFLKDDDEVARHRYKSIWASEQRTDMDAREARDRAIVEAINNKVDYLFMVDGSAQLTNPNALKLLIERNRPIVAPLLAQDAMLFSNFWGELSDSGYYKRSDDYIPIVQGKRLGIWNMPYISRAVLIQKDRLLDLKGAFSADTSIGADMSFPKVCRDKGYFMWVDNTEDYGLLTNDDDVNTDSPHPDVYELTRNRQLWERKYLHPDYRGYLDEKFKQTDFEEPCPDVPRFAMLTERFCAELIDIMEHFGKWSSGSNYDERLDGGYENVPTRDIHMKQVGLEQMWLTVLKDYVRPIQEKYYIGYYSRNGQPESIMNFVVRYRPDEQPELRAHHDASTYTLNMALNMRERDFEGGGCRFLRYNCSVLDTQPGHVMLQPGRLTHMHEGLRTTAGTRYIMISFIDP